ncbi:MAG: bifunctional diaminohydroxyphosphoribosylaminopyrimidine deaminase/5-amino-6-(5-phosphoribosylamino)uracil reductase RibD [Desulfonauticus sp.]|nr:bifunctional diaminohydroxyphosphoribosylaminopyrimidine deaminase/5-amino-6-(5-phosphoribosylamino)uracil reductase RibD [Desulfonauticus sp.]
MNEKQIKYFMRQAIALAKRGKGKTAPNPCVGAVLVQDQKIVARGYHKAYGLPHAEVEAISQARKKNIDLSKCVLFVTLEPCNHHGKTPPCTKAILEANIKEVYVGLSDPNPDVKGGGIDFLRTQGLTVRTNVLEKECGELIADFCCWTLQKRPYFYLKLASTLDGKIATRTGDAKWVSGEKSRQWVQRLRSKVQAVLVGGQTFKQDNPQLTVRANPFDKQPLALILTRFLPQNYNHYFLLRSRAHQTVFFCLDNKENRAIAPELEKLGTKVAFVPLRDGYLNLNDVASWLWEQHIYYVLIEGGGFIAQKFMSSNLVDEFYLFLAPKVLGDKEGISSFWGRKIDLMQDCFQLDLKKTQRVGEDLLLVFRTSNL